MTRINLKRGTLAGVGVAVALVAAAGTAIATAGDSPAPAAPEAAAPSPTTTNPPTPRPGTQPDNLRLTTGSYAIDLLEWDAGGKQGLGTVVSPHAVEELPSYDAEGYDITDEQFFLATETGELPAHPGQEHGKLIASYPQPTAGHTLDCTASGTAADPVVQCVTK
ncbi:hypothetical protein VSH64_07905 [Amycolatopsis rhabdoformis]|uniref:Secreted protein n=1 Tax=Amycolatopsis rhabdoformis TaxID=1448059 RepID=A0ABZ1ID96_9PSEU|nr:hypothetical protein [Amycolatopsis rhabdoformis]WSE32031.1 hypothetical protein VSH64_07905 [Amycolatopsis rhabdoformis]